VAGFCCQSIRQTQSAHSPKGRFLGAFIFAGQILEPQSSRKVLRMLATQNFDCLWVHFLFMTTYIEQFFLSGIPGQTPKRPIFVLDEHNVDEFTYKNFLRKSANPFRRMYAVLEIFKAQSLQKRWFPRFDAILCVSPEDRQKTANMLTNPRTFGWLPMAWTLVIFSCAIGKNSRSIRL